MEQNVPYCKEQIVGGAKSRDGTKCSSHTDGCACYMVIGQRLTQRIKDLGLTGNEVARRLGLGSRRFNNYMNDKREPDFIELVRICEELRTHPNYLFGFDDKPELGDAAGHALNRILSELNHIKAKLPDS